MYGVPFEQTPKNLSDVDFGVKRRDVHFVIWSLIHFSFSPISRLNLLDHLLQSGNQALTHKCGFVTHHKGACRHCECYVNEKRGRFFFVVIGQLHLR